MLYFQIHVRLKKMGYSEKGSNEKGLCSPIANILIYAYKILLNLKHACLFPSALRKKESRPRRYSKFKKENLRNQQMLMLEILLYP